MCLLEKMDTRSDLHRVTVYRPRAAMIENARNKSNVHRYDRYTTDSCEDNMHKYIGCLIAILQALFDFEINDHM